MPEKKTALKKKPVSQLLPAVLPAVPVSASTATTTPSLPPLVTEESIAKLITLTMSSPDLLLGLIWKHTFREGSMEGFRRGTELFKDLSALCTSKIIPLQLVSTLESLFLITFGKLQHI
jgi:hypothetical protein